MFTHIWNRINSLLRIGFQRLDTLVAAALLSLIASISRSPLGRRQALAEFLQRLHVPNETVPGVTVPVDGPAGPIEQITPNFGSAEAPPSPRGAGTEGAGSIVSQPHRLNGPATASTATLAVTPGAMTVIRRSTRLGAVAVTAAFLLWTLPGFGPAKEPQTRNVQAAPEQQAATPTPGFAVVNPANVQQTPDENAEPGGDVNAAPNGAAPTATLSGQVAAPNIVRSVGAAAASQADDPAEITSEEDAADTPAPTPTALLPRAQGAASGGAKSAELPFAAAGVNRSIVAALLVPTPTFAPVPTRDIPLVQLIPEIEFKLPGGMTPTPTPTFTPTPTPVPIVLAPGRLWSNFQPEAGPEADHFWIGRPFGESIAGQLASPSYQFGSTAGNRYRVHHGIDTSNPVGTPVRAATTGEVMHAGWDEPDLLGPYGGFYGNAVVIRLDRRLPVAGGELDVFLLYGHLNEVLVEKGQRVTPDDIIGRVGMTGIAIGPHLHTEVRLGANTYQHSVNPYLWVQPKDNAGAVAVRLLTADGRTWAGARVSLARFDGGRAVWARQIETYMDTENIGPDPYWGENGAMGSVPPGRYYVIAQVNGESLRTEIDVLPGQTTFVELRTEQ